MMMQDGRNNQNCRKIIPAFPLAAETRTQSARRRASYSSGSLAKRECVIDLAIALIPQKTEKIRRASTRSPLLYFFFFFFLQNNHRGCTVYLSLIGVSQVVKNLSANGGDTRHPGSNSGSGRSPVEGNGNPLQYSCLGYFMAWGL